MRKVAQVVCSNHCMGAIDIVCANLGILLAFALRFGLGFAHVHNFQAYYYCIPFLVVATMAVMYVNDLYTNWLHRSGSQLATSLLLSTTMLTVCIMALSFWGRQFEFPRSVIGLSFILQVVLFVSTRRFIQVFHQKHVGAQRVLVIGEDEQAVSMLISKFRQNNSSTRFAVEGFLPSDCISELPSRLDEVDVVAISASVSDKAEAVEICSRNGKEVLIVPRMVDLLMHTARAETVDDLLMFAIRTSSLTPGQLLVKRAVDILGSALILVIASPVMALLAILIPLTSKGSPIFRQERVGRHGTRYVLYKFRTMILDAERYTGPALAEKDDLRVTRFGRLLRATRLDELPQLFNVLHGDMSLVGPRPERPFFVRKFEHSIPNYSLRMMVKPGITGLAQIKGRYDTTAERKLRFDLLYICNYSFVLDLRILVQTLRVTFEPEQAAGVDNIVARSEFSEVIIRAQEATGGIKPDVQGELATNSSCD